MHGFFTYNGKPMTDAQVRRMVNWGIEHGCRTEADIPEDNVRNDKYGHSEIISDLKEMYRKRIAWLKSLKERFGCEVSCTTKKE